MDNLICDNCHKSFLLFDKLKSHMKSNCEAVKNCIYKAMRTMRKFEDVIEVKEMAVESLLLFAP